MQRAPQAGHDQIQYFTVERLLSIKAAHESWVRTKLAGFDPNRQADDERWAGYIEEWASRADLDNWLEQTYPLLQPTPGVDSEFFNALSALREWILSRIWPDRYPELIAALHNFRKVIGDFVNVFDEYSEPERDGAYLRTEHFYKIREWNREL